MLKPADFCANRAASTETIRPRPQRAGARRVSPSEWKGGFSASPVASSSPALLADGLLQRWVDTSSESEQPCLDHHNVCLHLGGPKRVSRTGEGHTRAVEIGERAITVVPAGAAFHWSTQGPVDYAFLFVPPRRLSRTIIEDFDRDPNATELQDGVGLTDALLGELLSSMTQEIASPGPHGKLLMESLYQAVLVRLLCTHSSLSDRAVRARHELAPFRLRRVLERIEQDFGGPLDLEALAATAGLSRYHFSRAFRQATGIGPCAFVTQRRIEEAKRLLRRKAISIADVARQCGLGDAAHFASNFRKCTGQTPSSWRRDHS